MTEKDNKTDDTPSSFAESLSFSLEANNVEPELMEDAIDIIRANRSVIEDNEWTPTQPASHSQVWRYLDFVQLVSILEQEKLWFTNNRQFDDPYEGTIPEANVEEEIQKVVETIDIERDIAHRIHNEATKEAYVTNGYVNCWTQSDSESAALWEQYIDSPQGVAITTTIEKLKGAIKSKRDLIFGIVRYIDYSTDRIPSGRGKLPPLYHKRVEFKHESEYRISFVEDSYVGNGEYIDVDANELIDEIYLSPRSDDWFADLTAEVLNTYGVDCDLRSSTLY